MSLNVKTSLKVSPTTGVLRSSKLYSQVMPEARCETVMSLVVVAWPDRAVIVVLPFITEVTTPVVRFTVATDSALLVQVTGALSITTPLVSSTVAVRGYVPSSAVIVI